MIVLIMTIDTTNNKSICNNNNQTLNFSDNLIVENKITKILLLNTVSKQIIFKIYLNIIIDGKLE